MPVARVGTAQLFQSSTQDTSHSVTIPTGCDCVVVAISGYQAGAGTATQLVDELALDAGGQDFVKVGFAQYGAGFNACQVDAYVMTASSPNWPGTGGKTLIVRSPAARGEGFNVGVAYYSGVDQSAPIVDTDSHTGSDDGTSFTSVLTGVGADDMGMVAAYNFNSAPTVSGGSQNSVLTGNFNSAGFGLADELGEDEMLASASDLVGLAWALRAAADSEPDVDEIDGQDIAIQSPFVVGGAIGQVHALTGQDLSTSSPFVESGPTGQTHVISADNAATGSPAAQSGAIGQSHAIGAQGVTTGAPEAQSGAIGQTHALSGNNADTGSPEAQSGTIGQVHALTGADLATGSPAVQSGSIGSSGTEALDGQDISTASPETQGGSISQVHAIGGQDVATGSPLFTLGSIGQIHGLIGLDSATGSPIVETGTLLGATPDTPPTISNVRIAAGPTVSNVRIVPGPTVSNVRIIQ